MHFFDEIHARDLATSNESTTCTGSLCSSWEVTKRHFYLASLARTYSSFSSKTRTLLFSKSMSHIPRAQKVVGPSCWPVCSCVWADWPASTQRSLLAGSCTSTCLPCIIIFLSNVIDVTEAWKLQAKQGGKNVNLSKLEKGGNHNVMSRKNIRCTDTKYIWIVTSVPQTSIHLHVHCN